MYPAKILESHRLNDTSHDEQEALLAYPPLSGFTIEQAELQAHRLFTGLLWAVFGLGLLLAPWHSTWTAALALGLPAALLPTLLMRLRPHAPVTRGSVGASLALFTTLFLHQTQGLNEVRFLAALGLVALLAYRDVGAILAAGVGLLSGHLASALLRFENLPLTLYAPNTGLLPCVLHLALFVALTALLLPLAKAGRADWILREEADRLTEILDSRRRTAGRALERIEWERQSRLAALAESVNRLLQAQDRRFVNVWKDAEALVERAERIAQESARARETSEQVVQSLQAMVQNAAGQAQRAMEASASMQKTTAQGLELTSAAREQAALAESMQEALLALKQRAAQVVAAGTEQAAMAEETVSLWQEAQGRAARVAETAHIAGDQVTDAIFQVEQGRDGLTQTIRSAAGQVSELEARSGALRETFSALSQLAGQINLFALNAAIEAVRAGENGQSIARLSEEARRLAERAGGIVEQAETRLSDLTDTLSATRNLLQGEPGLHADALCIVTDVQRTLTDLLTAFSQAQSAAEALNESGEMASLLISKVQQMARFNLDVAEYNDQLSQTLGVQAETLRTQVDKHDRLAAITAEQVASADIFVQGIAAISQQGDMALQTVNSAVTRQQESLNRLIEAAGDVISRVNRMQQTLGIPGQQAAVITRTVERRHPVTTPIP